VRVLRRGGAGGKLLVDAVRMADFPNFFRQDVVYRPPQSGSAGVVMDHSQHFCQ
jgi:hypothetical protein